MASVFKRKRRNKKGKVVEAKKFTCQYLDPVTGKTCRAPGYSDRSESRRLADMLEAGTATTDHRKHRKTPLADHLSAFVCHLRAINNAEKYVKVVETRITRILDGCNFETLRHITLPALENWLAAEREKKSFHIATSNEYGSAFKSFLTWLADSDRAESNPVARFSPLTDTDVKREYRALTPDEFSRLISSTLAGPAYRTMNGADRAVLYLVASYSGLRASELASLTAESFEGDFVLVEAAFSKRRRLDRQPLPADLVEAMRGWLPGRSGKLWPGSWSHDAAAMLRPDLAVAGIPDVDVVFHSLRHTYITALAAQPTYRQRSRKFWLGTAT